METLKIYRKRLIPEECILLKDDILLYRDEHVIITKWVTLHPKKDLDHGLSCYFLEHGVKVSKFYDREGKLLSWYCDIVSYTYDKESDTYVFTDLLADVIISPDGFVKVVDLDELADAREQEMISKDMILTSLRQLNALLTIIYKGDFCRLQKYIEDQEEKSGQAP
ncbi:DUF402 domain-containing protein [Murimonas intestini]|uniref:DUF402 domain-containing protein n=1 Tax=Murimonas intestini TaxID=1337051 RepID=A0AB73T5M6_9FIRM|nr:DUF402 domain-containing protein [Murimonas intestini]MCR1842145.1 DUF402 domain-containing protein [Murimonas intestini]MCR1864881.1 DUF402 domain-containing protein [Murimonas intestini]MCR1884209.1 DUF402 domain-containing protein [Murimonas intestini]